MSTNAITLLDHLFEQPIINVNASRASSPRRGSTGGCC